MGGVTFTSVPTGAPLTCTAVTSNIAGRTSVTTTFGAGEFALFVTTRVNVTDSPTEAMVGFPVFDSAGSTI